MLLHKELTDEILNAFYEVYNELGYGFLEKEYQNVLFLNYAKEGFSRPTKALYSLLQRKTSWRIFYGYYCK